MDSDQLKFILTHNEYTKKHFQTVLPYDMLHHIKKPDKKYQSHVINSSISKSPGVHWICIYGNINEYEIFDPLGFAPKKFYKDLYFKLKSFSKKVISRNHQIQSFSSISCGMFCCIYLHLRGLDLSQEQIFNKFFKKTDIGYNESLVSNFLISPLPTL